MSDKLEKLLETMRDKSPLLLLGAGFSFGATNGKGRQLPSGKELANELYDNVLAKAPLKPSEFVELRKHRDELKHVCDYIRSVSLVNTRNTFLVERMSGCVCPKDSFHMKLRKYPWRYIFTLNIDDLVEHIYNDTKLTIRVNGLYKQGIPGAPELIKLHGSVGDPDCGFAFDSTEYRTFMASDNWLLMQFGLEFLNRDAIILGTEFQEDDLMLVIERFQRVAGYTKDLNYFFVTPEIHDWNLRHTIENASNMHHIELKSEEFMEFIDDNIVAVGENRNKLKDYGAIFLDQKRNERTYDDAAHLYMGETPRYSDFFKNWDIRYPFVPEEIKTHISKGESEIWRSVCWEKLCCDETSNRLSARRILSFSV